MKKKLLVFGMGMLLLTLILGNTFAQKAEKTSAFERLQAAIGKMEPKNELLKQRTLNRRVFKKKDGKIVSFIATDPLNYLDDDNQWNPIDVKLISEAQVKSDKKGKTGIAARFPHHVLKNSIKARFSNQSDGGVQLEYKKHAIEFVLGHKNKRQASIDNNKIQYKKVFDNGDLVYTILPGKVKDEIIFYSLPKTPVITYKVTMSEKLVPQTGPEGSVNLTDSTGNAIFQLLPAEMFEKADQSQSKIVETKFHWVKNELYCDMILDMSWLKDKRRHYPVVVDPIVSPAPTSSGKTKNRTLIHCPENYGQIKCTIDLDGPGWHGHLSDYDNARVYFKDRTSGQVYLNYDDINDYHPGSCEVNMIANHDYEIYLYGGRARHDLDGAKYNGYAWAMLEYGGLKDFENGHLFSDLPDGYHFTGINTYVVIKNIYLKYPQTIHYKYSRESSKGDISDPVIPYFRISPGPNLGLGSGDIQLNPGYYQLELSPSNREHYQAELEFPLGTGYYEKKIVLRTDPGSIESTFTLPSSREVLMEYQTIRNGDPSSQAYPQIKIASGSEIKFLKDFALDYWNVYDGGDKVYLEKDKLYTLTVSRGKSGGNGWGEVYLDFFFPLNKFCRAQDIQLVDKNGQTAGSYAGDDYQLRFNYQDDPSENHTLKSYTLMINDTQYQFNNVNAGNGWVTIPYSIKDFKLHSGVTFHCSVKVYDGFDFADSALGNFTVDTTPPEIQSFSGEVVAENGVNNINLLLQAQDKLSSLQRGELSWKINGEAAGSRSWTNQSQKETLSDLPDSAKVDVSFTVTDQVNNSQTLTKTFYTKPEESNLVAPKDIYTTKPGKYHPTLKFAKTHAGEYRIQRYLRREAQSDLLEYDTGYMDASTLSTVTVLPPGLNIVSPVSGTSFGRPAYITLTAFTDSDTPIYQVEFYANGQFIGRDTSSPFRFLWSNVPPGQYTLTAVATDVDGLSQTSPPVTVEVTNIYPTVRIITPVSGDSYAQPGNIYIRVDATDSDSEISQVDFYNGDQIIGSDTTNPYSMVWYNVPYGDYNLTAKATDSDNAISTSDPVTVHVTNQKPNVVITSPSNDFVYAPPANIKIDATASDNDGTINRVEFYANDILKGSATGSPYSFTWSGATVGTYALKAKAIDDDGEGTWSNPVYVQVIETPDDKWYGQISNGISWSDLPISDNVNDSGAQAFFHVHGYSAARFTTYYWVPRDMTITNTASHDDGLTVYVNGVQVYSSSRAGSGTFTVNLKGKQWNQVYMNAVNGKLTFALTLSHNFKYLIQQALGSDGVVYMSSRRNQTSVSSMNLTDNERVLATNQVQQSSGNQNATMNGSGTNVQECYAFMDLLPVDSHQTYVYKISTRNGDQITETTSEPVKVMNNIPELNGVEPNPGTKSYSNGAFSIRVTGAVDYDQDPLQYHFTINGPVSLESKDPNQKEFTGNNLPDGNYTWSVKVNDGLGGESSVNGTMVVDKEIPTALFSINNSSLYSTSRAVHLKVSDASSNVDKIRISNDKLTWSEFIGGNQEIDWNLIDGDGRKVVYLQAHKEAGDSWGPVVERSITLDSTAPEVSNLSISNEGDTGKVTFYWVGGKDATSGLTGNLNIQIWQNGDWTDYQNGYQENKIEIPASGYGTPVKIRVQLSDNAGNLSDWSAPSEGFTKAAPGRFDLTASGSGYSESEGHFLNLKLNAAEGAVQYKIECTGNPGGGDIAFVSGDLVYRDKALIPHQTYKYRILSYNSNDEITIGDEVEFSIANNLPSKPVGTGPKGLLNHQDGLQFAFDRMIETLDPDGDSLDVTYQLSTDGENYSDLSTNIPCNLREGVTYWWKAVISDNYGGTVITEPVEFSIDATPPTIIVDNLSAGYAQEQRVRINVSDNNGSGIKVLKINGVITKDLNSEVVLNTHGANDLLVEATDQAGNSAVFSHTYYVDREPPVCSDIHFGLPDQNGIYLASSNIIPVIWQAGDPESGVAKFKYSWSNNPNTVQEAGNVSVIGEGIYQADVLGNFTDGQIYYLNLQAENYLGLTGWPVTSLPVLYDHTGPLLTIGSISSGTLFNGLRYLQSIQQISITVNAADPHTGISRTEYALVETAANDSNTLWYDSLDHLKENCQVNNGKIYYVAIRVTNGTNLMTTAYSEPFIIDGSEPVLTLTAQNEQQDRQTYLAQVAVSDPDTMVVQLEYGIGNEPGKANLSKGLPGADANGWFTIDYPGSFMELRNYANIPLETVYYVTVKAINVAGVTAIKTSNGTKVIGGNCPVVRDDGNYTSDNTRLYFEWSFPDNTRSIREFQYKIRTADGTIVRDWQSAAGAQTLLVEGLALINNTRYYCEVQAVFEDGSVSGAGISDGILVDTTLPEITAFTVPQYVNGEGIDLTWEANDPESGIKGYAGIGVNPGETGVTKGWIYLGNMKRFRITHDTAGQAIEFTHNQKYYLTLMVQNGAGTTIQQIGSPVLIDLTPPEPPVVIDEGKYSNRNDQLKFSWKWPIGDPESGIREYQFCLTTQPALSGGEQWYPAELAKEILRTDLELVQGASYYLAVKAINNAGAESVGFSDGILIDTTAPTPPVVVDHGDYSLSNSALKVSMVASDAESGIAGYTLSLGTIDNLAGVIQNRTVLSGTGQEDLSLDGLNLKDGGIYYFTISATDNAGNESMQSASDGVMIDSKSPEVQSVTVQGKYLADSSRLVFDWTAKPAPSGIIDAQYAISNDPNGTNLTWQSADLSGSQIVTGLSLEEGKTYYVFVRIQNRALAENTPQTWSVAVRSNPVVIDKTPPEILNVHAPEFMSKHFLLQWEARDGVSGIAEYRYAVGSYRGGTDVTDGWVSVVTDKANYSTYRDDLALLDNHAYYISLIAKNGAGLWSGIYKSEAIKTDLTPPVVSKLFYGSQYLNIKDKKDGIRIEWTANDEQSGIGAYRIKLVSMIDNQDLETAAILTNQTNGNINLTDLNVRDGEICYIAFQAQNQLGQWSKVSYTGAVRVDLTAPTVTVVNARPEMVINEGRLEIAYVVSETSTVAVKLVYPSKREDTPDPQVVTGENIYDFNPQPDGSGQQEEGRYQLFLSPTDLAGNPGIMNGIPGVTVPQIIRINARPLATIGPDLIITKGSTVHFQPEVSDSDGYVDEYDWHFGNGQTSTEANPSCTYKEVQLYKVTLKVKDNEDKCSELSTQNITVTNTGSGSLLMDEEWDGSIVITGDVTVPQGVILTIKAGTVVTFTGNYQIKVLGKLVINGTRSMPVTIGATATLWNGIRVEQAESGSQIQYAIIQGASVGLVLSQSEVQVANSTFKNNRIGLHVLNCSPAVQNSTFQDNLIYGIKEDDNAGPVVTGCGFSNNQVADYYEDKLGIIGMETLNQLGSNKGNIK